MGRPPRARHPARRSRAELSAREQQKPLALLSFLELTLVSVFKPRFPFGTRACVAAWPQRFWSVSGWGHVAHGARALQPIGYWLPLLFDTLEGPWPLWLPQPIRYIDFFFGLLYTPVPLLGFSHTKNAAPSYLGTGPSVPLFALKKRNSPKISDFNMPLTFDLALALWCLTAFIFPRLEESSWKLPRWLAR